MIYVFVVIGLKLQINYQIIKSNFFALGAKTGTLIQYEIGITYIVQFTNILQRRSFLYIYTLPTYSG